MLLWIRASFVAGLAVALAASVAHASGTVTRASGESARGHSWISPSAMRQAKSTGLLFVSDTNNHVVDIYSSSKPSSPIGQIAGILSLPEALAVDKAGNLFVYEARTATILEFVPPYTHPPAKEFYARGQQANGISVDANGTIYSANEINAGVIEYVRGRSQGKEIPLPVGPTGVTVDAQGNLICTFNGNGGAGVLEKPQGSPIPANLLIPLEVNPSDVLFDSAGNLVVENTTAGTINVYKPHSRRPSSEISGFITPLHMAFAVGGQVLYVSDSGSGSNGSIKAVDYPSGKVLWQLTGFSSYSPEGIAVSPAAVP